MGIIRGILLVLVSVTLFLSLFATALFWTLSSSLVYENVQDESVLALGNLLNSTEMTGAVSAIIPVMQLYCENNTEAEYVFSEAGYTMSIPCSDVSQGENAIINGMIRNLVDVVYYTNYENCNFWDCGGDSELPLFLISEKAQIYWTSKFYLLLGVSLVLILASFLLIGKKTTTPILVGVLLIVVSIPFLNLTSLFSLFSDPMVSQLLNIFFSQSFNVSLKLLIWGIALILLGVVFKIFKIGFFISELLSKFQKSKEKTSSETSSKKEKSKSK